MTQKERGPVMLAADVAELWSKLRGEPVHVRTVYSYLEKSKQADAERGRETGRYANNPVPKPNGYMGTGKRGNPPWWDWNRADELAEWWTNRTGPGAGGGRKPKAGGSVGSGR